MNQDEHTAVILTEAGKGIGYGHFTRCHALKKYLEQDRVDCLMLLDIVGSNDFQDDRKIKRCDWKQNPTTLKSYAEQYNIVIIDSYRADTRMFDYIQSCFRQVTVLDDFNRLTYAADLVLNPNIFFADVDYSNQTALVIGGEKFVICRRPFVNKIHSFIVRKKVRHVLITLGGRDYRKLAPQLINAFKHQPCTLSIVAGDKLYQEELIECSNGNIQVFGYLEDREMVSRMLEADIVITAAGQTLNELACLGVPTIAINIDQDQDLNMAGYVKKGFLLDSLYWHDSGLMGKVLRLFLQLHHRDVRCRLSDSGKKLVDGNGVERICGLIKN